MRLFCTILPSHGIYKLNLICAILCLISGLTLPGPPFFLGQAPASVAICRQSNWVQSGHKRRISSVRPTEDYTLHSQRLYNKNLLECTGRETPRQAKRTRYGEHSFKNTREQSTTSSRQEYLGCARPFPKSFSLIRYLFSLPYTFVNLKMMELYWRRYYVELLLRAWRSSLLCTLVPSTVGCIKRLPTCTKNISRHQKASVEIFIFV